MKNIGSLLLVYSPRYVDHVMPRVSILNLGFRASAASFTICAPVWRPMLPLLKERVNLNPLSQTCPPQASLNSATALSLPGSYHFPRAAYPSRPHAIGPLPSRPLPRTPSPLHARRSRRQA